MYYFIKGKYHDVKKKTVKIVAQREYKFLTMIRQAEIKFLEIHELAIENTKQESDNEVVDEKQ